MKGVAIIPARAGSKRIPKKNIKLFNGKPMIHFALRVALDSKIFDRVIVTSDSEEILSTSKEISDEIEIYERSKKLSDDFTGTLPVINDVIDNLQIQNSHDFTCCLYSCVPLLDKKRLIEGYDLLKNNPTKYILPIKKFESSIYRSFSLDSNKFIDINFSSNQLSRTQDLKDAYYDAGQFYFGTNELWQSKTNLHSCSLGIELSKYECIDIDELEDWTFAEKLFQIKNHAR